MSTNEGLIFYKSFFEAIETLPKREQLEIYRAIPDYVFNEKEPNLKGMQKTIWVLIKPQLKANIQKRKNGQRGGRPRSEITAEDLED